MNLKKLSLEATLRITNGSTDEKIDLFKSLTGYTIDSNLYQLFFMQLPAGNVTGLDKTEAPAFFTGVKFVCNDTTGAELAASSISETNGKFDWYEDESNYIAQVAMTHTVTGLATDKYLYDVVLTYVGNLSGVATPYTLLTSTAPSLCSFAEVEVPAPAAPAVAKNGLQIDHTQDAVIKVDLYFMIAK